MCLAPGMFVWFRVNGVDDTQSLIYEKAVAAKVLLLPGQAFSPTGEPSSCVRASFSLALGIWVPYAMLSVFQHVVHRGKL